MITQPQVSGLWQRICVDDNDKAFEQLFYLLHQKLARFCVLYVHQKEIAEEIVADVFVRCWQNRKTLTGVQNPIGYLFVAVKNHSLNHLKKMSSIHVVALEDQEGVELIDLNDPQIAFEKKELFLKLDKAIAMLPRQCRIIFRLIKEDGMKYKEVAEILNISPRTVQTQLFRAIRKLSLALREDEQTYHQAGKTRINTRLPVIFWLFIFF